MRFLLLLFIGEHCIDGTLFLKKFLQLHQKAWVEYREKLKVNKKKKEYTLAMGQNVDFLPKLLGR